LTEKRENIEIGIGYVFVYSRATCD